MKLEYEKIAKMLDEFRKFVIESMDDEDIVEAFDDETSFISACLESFVDFYADK